MGVFCSHPVSRPKTLQSWAQEALGFSLGASTAGFSGGKAGEERVEGKEGKGEGVFRRTGGTEGGLGGIEGDERAMEGERAAGRRT